MLSAEIGLQSHLMKLTQLNFVFGHIASKPVVIDAAHVGNETRSYNHAAKGIYNVEAAGGCCKFSVTTELSST